MRKARGPLAWFRQLGPGLVTGAADDDPSGIVTYSQAGAAFGYALGWSVVVTLPFMVAVQEISARLGRVTGGGLALILRRHAPRPVVRVMVLALVIANVINLGADIDAMAATVRLVAGGPVTLYALAFAVICASAEIWVSYRHYVRVLKWLTTALLAYVALLFVAHISWTQALAGALIPHLPDGQDALVTLLAVFGTTISPYLFFWQAAEEAEDELYAPTRGHCASTRATLPARCDGSASIPGPAWPIPTWWRWRS